MPLALPSILAISCMIVALGLIMGGTAFVNALFAIFKKSVFIVPGADKLLGGTVRRAQQSFNNAMMGLVAGLEEGISTSWHVMADLMIRIGGSVYDVAHAYTDMYWYVTVRWPLAQISKLADTAYKDAKHALQAHGTTTVKQTTINKYVTAPTTGPIGAAIGTKTKPVKAQTAHLDRWARARIAALGAAIGIAIPAELDHLGAVQDALGRAISDLKAKLKALPVGLGSLAFAGAVAATMARLGAGASRCTKANKWNKAMCGVDDGLLNSLIVGLTVIGGTLSVRTFAEACMAAQDEVAPLMTKGIRELRAL